MTNRTLTPARLAEMQDCFERALELSSAGREVYLSMVSTTDADLAARVRALLEAHEGTAHTLESPVSGAVRLLDPSQDRWIGSRVGVYQIARRIGAGGMGTVYEAIRADTH